MLGTCPSSVGSTSTCMDSPFTIPNVPVPTSSSSSSIKAVWTFTDLGCFSWEMKSQSCVKKKSFENWRLFSQQGSTLGATLLSLLTTKRFYSNPQPPHWSGEGSVHRGQQLGPRARKILVTAGVEPECFLVFSFFGMSFHQFFGEAGPRFWAWLEDISAQSGVLLFMDNILGQEQLIIENMP